MTYLMYPLSLAREGGRRDSRAGFDARIVTDGREWAGGSRSPLSLALLAGKLRRALLDKGLHPFREVFRARHQLHRLIVVFYRGREVGEHMLPDHPLRLRDAERRAFACDVACYFARGLHQLVMRHDAIDEADRERFLCVDEASGYRKLHRAGRADDPREHPARTMLDRKSALGKYQA